MKVQMSNKSKIYHRHGCRFIRRIKNESLVPLNINDRTISRLKPCKCCCTIKALYNNYKENLRIVFENLPITTTLEGEYVRVHTDRYDWRIYLKKSSQNIRLYREEWNEEYQKVNLIKCDGMDKSKNIAVAMKYIANEERAAKYQVPYRKQALQIERFAEETGIQIEYDDTCLYILTDMAIWKIIYEYHSGFYKLLHCPFNGHALTMDKAGKANYHVQKDVPQNQSPYKHLQYIVKHDEAKKIEQIDYKKLPQKTKKQKQYYHQAENRARRKSINNVLDILAQLEANGELTKTDL